MTLRERLAALGVEQRRQLQIAFEAESTHIVWLEDGWFLGVNVTDDSGIIETAGVWCYGRIGSDS